MARKPAMKWTFQKAEIAAGKLDVTAYASNLTTGGMRVVHLKGDTEILESLMETLTSGKVVVRVNKSKYAEHATDWKELYEQGYSLRRIAEQYKVNQSTILRNLRTLGVPLRKRGRRPKKEMRNDS